MFINGWAFVRSVLGAVAYHLALLGAACVLAFCLLYVVFLAACLVHAGGSTP